MRDAPHPRREGDEALPASLPSRFPRSRLFLPAILVLGLAVFLWPGRELGSDNFVFYFPSGHHLVPIESVGGAKYLPLLPLLNMVGKVEGIQEKKNSVKLWFGTTQIELRPNDRKVLVAKASYELSQPAHQSDGQWMVPVDFLTIILPRLTHQPVEYQDGTNRIFIGDVKPASFTVRVDPVANGARLTVQFTDKVTVRTASSNGKWVMFLGDRPMEPMEPSFHFQNPYLSDLQYDDQDGLPKLILSPTSGGLNFYPVQAEGGKILLADVLKPPSPTAQALPPQPAPPTSPEAAQSTPEGTTSPGTEESPATPPGPPLPVVALDAGHGGADNGGRSRDGISEKDLAAQYVFRVRAALLATNLYRVVLSRTADVSVTDEQRALAANLSGAICFLSFHAGDLGTASPRITIFTYQPPSPPAPVEGDAPAAAGPPTPTSAFVPWGQVQEARLGQSLQLALALQQQLAQVNGVEVDMPATAPVRILRSVNAPAVAIELGRLAPDADATALTNPAFQQQIAGAVVQALATFAKGGN
jgi:N-acetylmuramoyl-L-alanine amidase